jgi:hypothetical protein
MVDALFRELLDEASTSLPVGTEDVYRNVLELKTVDSRDVIK